MAFKRFHRFQEVEVPVATESSWAQIEANGDSAYIIHFNVEACQQHELKAGDKINLFFDEDNARLGVEKASDGDYALTVHGGNPKRLKAAITDFYREFLESRNMVLPCKMDVLPPHHRSKMLFVVELPPPNVRKPRSDRGVKRAPYKPRSDRGVKRAPYKPRQVDHV